MAQFSISVADDETGTSATVTPANDAGDPWFVYVFRVSGSVGVLAETLAGIFEDVASGTVTLSKGYYFARAVRGVGASPEDHAPLVYFRVTDGADAEASQVRDAIKARVELLALDGIGGNVYVQMTPSEVNVKFPCVLVIPWNLTEDNPQNLSTLDDWGHPNWVWICDRQSPIDHKQQKKVDRWRQDIRRAFHNQQIPTPRTCVRCAVETHDILDPRLPKFQYLISQLVVRVYTREARGLGA